MKKIYVSTLKEILRSRVTYICCLATLLLCFFLHGGNGMLVNGQWTAEYGMTIAMYTLEITQYVSLIGAIIISVTYLNDYRNSFYEIEQATMMKRSDYLLGKALAYLLFFYGWSILLTIDYFFSSYVTLSSYFQYAEFPFWITLRDFAVCYLFILIPFGFFFVCFMMALSDIFKRNAAAIFMGILFIIIPLFFENQPLFKSAPPFLSSFYNTTISLAHSIGVCTPAYTRFTDICIQSADQLIHSCIFLLLGAVCLFLLYFVCLKRTKK